MHSFLDLEPLQKLAVAALLVGLIATALPWVKFDFGATFVELQGTPGYTCSGWTERCGPEEDHIWFQIGDWLGTASLVDALFVALVVVACLYILGAQRQFGLLDTVTAPIATGMLLLVVGALNYFFINDQISSALTESGITQDDLEDLGISIGPGFGIYLLMLAGLVAAVAGYLHRSRTAAGAPANTSTL
jgi:hypothetical protein